MEKRDYLEREIEKMRAVIQKIFKLRVDKPEEVRDLISTELNQYFHLSLQLISTMPDETFTQYVQTLNIASLEFLGDLLFASVDLNYSLHQEDVKILRKVLFVWDNWELKTKTLDWEKLDLRQQIKTLIIASERQQIDS